MAAPFQFMHGDIANLELLGKSVTTSRQALLIADLYSSKCYAYPMPSRKQLLKYMGEFYIEINKKQKKVGNMRLQTDNDFQQTKIKDLNDKYNITMFTANVRGRKAFAAEQKIRELKKRISKIKAISDQIKAMISPTTIIKQSADNMNSVISKNMS